jgi:ParB family chromosome partitioning protein
MNNFKKNLLDRVKKEVTGGDKIEEIPVDKLIENPYQPRLEINKEEVEELAKSIKENGLLQPIVVSKTDNGYMIIAGHRRTIAHKLLGKNTIKAIVLYNQNNNHLAKKAIIENLQRKNLDLIETAMAIKNYKDEFNKTLDDIAKELGKTKGYISQILNVLNLPDEILNDIKQNKSTKDILSLNMLNSFAKKKFNMLNIKDNENDKTIQKQVENEVIELYALFLQNGRDWLKNEIQKRLNNDESDENKEINVKIQKKVLI